MKKLIYYKPRIVNSEENLNLPGIKKFSHFFELFNHDVVIIDRSGTLRLPVNTQNLFPIPTFKVFTKSYEEICNERALELLKRADEKGVRLCVFYSGGIDSTLVLVSLLKNATELQKNNITVLLSEKSIDENPNFYKKYIQNKLQVESSVNFMYLLGSKKMFISGENNDQIFGSDMVGKLMKAKGDDVIHKPYNRELFLSFFNDIEDNHEINSFYVDIFERLAKAAPVAILTNFHFLWWINFSLKWQNVFIRQLVFVTERNIEKINSTYIKEGYYDTFFNTNDFQLWSLNNLDKRIKNTWNSYKWICKDIIFDFTKDSEYRDNKTKIGSLANLMVGASSYNFVEDSFTFHKCLPVEEYYNKDNDFI